MSAKEIPFQKCETDLETKAQWHLDFNGGFLPILESPDGTMINESSLIMQFACDYAQGKGLSLYPHDSNPSDLAANIKTGQHRLAMQAFDKFMAPSFWGAFAMKFESEERNQVLIDVFPKLEAWFKE